MFSINFQVLAYVKDFRLLTPRQAAYHQLRLSVWCQSKISSKVPYCLNTYIQKPQQLIPYLILTPQQNATSINAQLLQVSQSCYRFDAINLQGNIKQQNKCVGFQTIMKSAVHQQQQLLGHSQYQQPQINKRQSTIRVVEHTKNSNNKNRKTQLGEIDLENNSFMTKPFFVQRTQHPIVIDQAVVFKGSLDVSVEQMMAIVVRQEQQRNKQASQQVNRDCSVGILPGLYISCELFLMSNYTTDSIGDWGGYALTDEGSVLLPVSFFSYNSSYSLIEITFLCSKIQYIAPQGRLQAYFTNDKTGLQRIGKIISYLDGKYDYLAGNVLVLPKQHSIAANNNTTVHQQSHSSLKPLQMLLQRLGQYNERIYLLWKAYQEFIQNTILSKGRLRVVSNAQNEQKLDRYQQALNRYHWKYHIQLTQCETNKTLNGNINSYSKPQSSLSIYRDLVFYPFSQHHRMVRLSGDDMGKIEKMGSLPLVLSTSNMEEQGMRIRNKMNSARQQQQPLGCDKVHLLIFVHGYQASSYDMQNLASFLRYKNPQQIRTFVSSCNQNRTQQPIQESGHRLAIEIKNYINNKFQYDKQEIEISFVCHSMGGLIVRAALKYLQLYKSQFRMYLSLCSPHLGYLYHSSALIKTSLWVLNQVKKDPSMIQLSMQDNPLLQKTYLYQLSKRTQLQWFKYPIFIGSREDEYVPYWSALVQDKQFYFQTTDAKVYKQLYKQLTENIQHKIIRLQTIYQDKINDISSFVGRTAHIRILNCIEIMEIIYMLVQKAF